MRRHPWSVAIVSQNSSRYRKHIRLDGHDYRLPGAYFITICTRNMRSLFGTITDAEMQINAYGRVVREEWLRTADVRDNVELDAYVVMPNHFHGILLIDALDPRDELRDGSRATHRVAATKAVHRLASGPRRDSVGAIIGQFKSHSTRRINQLRGTSGTSIWQRNYYEHIIRSDRAFERIREYIEENPGKWHDDRYFVGEVVAV